MRADLPALRKLIQLWRERSNNPTFAVESWGAFRFCADELEKELAEGVSDSPTAETWQPKDVDRWRTLYRALAWMVNDYIGICGLSADFTQKDKRLGYAHEGYHNAERVLRDTKPPAPERLTRFNDETACVSGGNSHPDRCICQRKETGQFADTPHKHYDDPPYRCARCNCDGYTPALPAPPASEATASDLHAGSSGATAPTSADRTLKSIAAMLGWMNVPPRHIFEMEIAAMKDRIQTLRADLDEQKDNRNRDLTAFKHTLAEKKSADAALIGLREALKKYGQHAPGDQLHCTCGLAAAIRASESESA